jgi:hypothetical protein
MYIKMLLQKFGTKVSPRTRALFLLAPPPPGEARAAAAAVPPRVRPAPCVRPAGVASPRCRLTPALVLVARSRGGAGTHDWNGQLLR